MWLKLLGLLCCWCFVFACLLVYLVCWLFGCLLCDCDALLFVGCLVYVLLVIYCYWLVSWLLVFACVCCADDLNFCSDLLYVVDINGGLCLFVWCWLGLVVVYLGLFCYVLVVSSVSCTHCFGHCLLFLLVLMWVGWLIVLFCLILLYVLCMFISLFDCLLV